jgi:hypothetical protein
MLMSISSESVTLQQTAPAENVQPPRLDHPPQVRMAFNVGVVGHRKLPAGNQTALADIVSEILTLVKQTLSEARGNPALGLAPFCDNQPVGLRIISPLAAGADQLVAQAGLELGYTLHCPLPFGREKYSRSFRDCEEHALDGSWRLLDRAESILQLDGDYDNAPELAYQAVGRVVLTYSDLLIAIWDGQQEKGIGGTAQIVREAHGRQIPIVWINLAKENEVGWFLEEDGHALCQPILEFSDLPSVQSLSDVLFQTYLPAKIAELQDHNEEELLPEESLRGYFRERCVDLCSRIVVRQLSRLWRTFYGCLTPRIVPSECHMPAGPAVEHYKIAEELAQHYGDMYRSSFVANYLLGGTAVLMAMLGPLIQNVFSKEIAWGEAAVEFCTAMELLSLAAICVNFYLARVKRWHDKFTDYRMLAEQLRQLEFMMPLGQVPSARAFSYDPDRPEEHWTTWYVRKLIHQIGICSGNLNNAQYRCAVEVAIRDKWIKEQRNYHQSNAKQCERLEHRLQSFAIVLFFITVGACVGHLTSFWQDVPWAPSLLTLLAAVCPAWAGAAHAISQYAELRRLQRRSTAMERELSRMAAMLEKKGSLPTSQLNELAFRAAEMMLQEAFDWRIQYRMSEMIPG